MSERVMHVYRVTEVAEYVVEDDQVYDDDVEMLRDVLDGAKAGLLDFAPTDAEFVVMTWNEDSAMTVRAAFPEGSVEAEFSPTDRRSGARLEYCPRCLLPQVSSPSGATCPNGHVGLPGIGNAERMRKVEERREIEGESPEASTSARTSTRRKRRSR